MLVRSNIKSDVLIEEMIHLVQHEKTGWKRLSVADILRLEVQAHNDLLRYAEENGWSAEQKAKLKQNRDYWEAQQTRYGKDPVLTEAMDAQVGVMTAKKGVNKTVDDFLNENSIKLTEQALLPSLKAELENNLFFRSLIENDPELIKAWELISSYRTIRTNPQNLLAAKKLINNTKLVSSGLSYDVLKTLIAAQRGPGSIALLNLLNGLDDLISSNTIFIRIENIISDLKKGGNFSVGAQWVIRCILENTDEFKGLKLSFEIPTDISGNIRRYDLLTDSGKVFQFYEFKSVAEIPPHDFAIQFLRDLQNPDITSIDQLKWYFDGTKISNLDAEAFLQALEKTKIPKNILNKWTMSGTKKEFSFWFKSNFNKIFYIK